MVQKWKTGNASKQSREMNLYPKRMKYDQKEYKNICWKNNNKRISKYMSYMRGYTNE
jgi:hypothetical protein